MAPWDKGHVRKSTDEATARGAVCIREGRVDWVDFTRLASSILFAKYSTH
jgi:hypothetical protein